jgi:hypothetical protein
MRLPFLHPGPGRRRLPAAYDAAVARVAALEPLAAEHDGCAGALDYVSAMHAELLTQYRAEKRRADSLDRLLAAARRDAEAARVRHAGELARARRPRPTVGSEDPTAATDTRVLRAQYAAERAIHESPVERTLTMPPLRGEVTQEMAIPLGVSPLALPVEVSPTSGDRARESVRVILGAAL